jgi:glycosyltransferase involved in cell wall biosynthesis
MLHHSGNIHPVGLWRLVRDPVTDLLRLEETPPADRSAARAAGPGPPRPRAGAPARGAPAAGAAAAGAAPGPPAPAAAPVASPAAQLTAAAPRDQGRPRVVVHSHIRWGSVWHRPQQLATRLARRRPLLYLEEPRWSADVVHGKLALHEPVPGITVAVPHLPHSLAARPAAAEAIVADLLRRHLLGDRIAPFARAVHLLTTPRLLPQLEPFSPQLVVYDCLDDLSRFAYAPADVRRREEQLLRRADLVLTRGEGLYERLRTRHAAAHWIPSGVDLEHWQRHAAAPHDVAFVPRPRLGYLGAVDERLDLPLLAELAERHPGWSLVLVGPVLKVDPAALPRGPNLFYLGQRPYAQLPAYAAALDALLLPFVIAPVTELAHPTKILEYLATGKPVVSTPVPEVAAHYGEAVHVAGRESFAERLREVLGGHRIDPALGIARAAQTPWETVAARVEALIDEALRQRAAEPVSEGELSRV